MLGGSLFLAGEDFNPVAAKGTKGNFGEGDEGEVDGILVDSLAIFFLVDFEEVMHILLSFNFAGVDLFGFLLHEPMAFSIIIQEFFPRYDGGGIFDSLDVLDVFLLDEVGSAHAFGLLDFGCAVFGIVDEESMVAAVFGVGGLTPEVDLLSLLDLNEILEVAVVLLVVEPILVFFHGRSI